MVASPPERYNASFSSISSQTSLSIRNQEELCEAGIGLAISSESSHNHEIDKCEKTCDIEEKIKARLHPKTRLDLQLMRKEVGQLREYKLKEIENDTKCNQEIRTERKARILSQETNLLRKIEGLGKGLTQKKLERRRKTQLSTMRNGEQIWIMSNGEKVLVETPGTRYAASLTKIYGRLADFKNQDGKYYLKIDVHICHLHALIKLNSTHLSFCFKVTERLQVLEEVIDIVSTINSSLAKEAGELFNREVEMLRRSMTASMAGLRARSLNLFLRVVEEQNKR